MDRHKSKTSAARFPIRMKRFRGPAHRNLAPPRDQDRPLSLAWQGPRAVPLTRRRSFCALYTGLHPGARQMAFFQDQRPSREPFLNAPATIFWLIGALVVAHVVRVILPSPWPESLLFEFAFIPAR